MANKKSARKRAEKSEQQREKNRAARSRLRTAVKKAREAAASDDPERASLVARAISVIDASAQKGIIHRNAAGRSKSRLSAAVKKSSAS